MGFGPEQNEELRRQRVAQLRSALDALLAAMGTRRLLASEWSDEALQQAATAVKRQLEAEVEHLTSTSPATGLV